MNDLERELTALAAELHWPETPTLEVRLEPRPHRPRRLVAAVAVAVLIGLAVALAVPSARSALLRVLHLGGVSVERVDTLPPTSRRPLDARLGPQVTRRQAAAALGLSATALPGGELHLEGGVVSVVLPGPLLLSELRTGPVPVLQKQLAGEATHATWSALNGEPALWITGARHLVRFPAAPARLAGNVLVWQSGPITYRLEGAHLARAHALALAHRITGT